MCVHAWLIHSVSVILLLYAANCGPLINSTSVGFHYSSTLEGSVITFVCLNSEDPQTFVSICQKSASWDPDPISHCTAQNSGIMLIRPIALN